jgi:anti-sigma-K factor RskA
MALLVWIGLDRNRLQGELAVAADTANTQQSARTKCADELARAQTESKLQRQALELLQRPGSRMVALAPQAGTDTHANIIFHSLDKQAFVVGGGLSAPSGKDYELWLIRGDKKIPAGLLKGKSDQPLVAAIDGALLAEGPPDAIAVTLEPEGGGEQPRGPIVLVGKI